VQNQQGFAAELLQISSSEGLALLNFMQSREKPSGENFSRAAPGGELRSPDPASRGDAAKRHAGRVSHRDGESLTGFGNGTVANQQW
jgi:hypothetical protein